MINEQFDSPQSELSKDKTSSDNNLVDISQQHCKIVRLMCDNVPDMIWAKDLKRCYTFANKGLCNTILLTNNLDEPVGKTADYFYEKIKNEKPDDENWYTICDLSVHSDDFVYKYRKPIQVIVSGYVKGEFMELELNKAPLFDDDNEFIGIVGAGRDVTKRRQIEKELRYSQERFQLAIEGASLGIWDLHIDTGKLFLDKRWMD
jgi:PAS domain-containing protein